MKSNKNYFDYIFKNFCCNCSYCYYDLIGKGSLFYYPDVQFGKTSNFFFYNPDDKFLNLQKCLELGHQAKHKSLCEFARFEIIYHRNFFGCRKNDFYKVFLTEIKKKHMRLNISEDCPFYFEIKLKELSSNF